jgi:hypothetical protein
MHTIRRAPTFYRVQGKPCLELHERRQGSKLAIVSLILESAARRREGISKTRFMEDAILAY